MEFDYYQSESVPYYRFLDLHENGALLRFQLQHQIYSNSSEIILNLINLGNHFLDGFEKLSEDEFKSDIRNLENFLFDIYEQSDHIILQTDNIMKRRKLIFIEKGKKIIDLLEYKDYCILPSIVRLSDVVTVDNMISGGKELTELESINLLYELTDSMRNIEDWINNIRKKIE